MLIYRVTQQIFDNGTIEAWIDEIQGPSIPAPVFEEMASCDFYIDYFVNHADAEQFLAEARAA